MKRKAVEDHSFTRRAASKVWAGWVHLLHERTIFVLTLMFVVGILVMLWYVARLQSVLVTSTALQNAAAYSQALAEFRTLYTSEVVEAVRGQGIEVTHDYATKENAIPLPATLSMHLGERIGARGSGAQTRLYSAYPFPWRREQGGLQDAFGEDAWSYLQQYPDAPFYRFEDFQGRPSLRYAVADRMRPSCVGCHNTHLDSPKTDWEVDQVRGVLEVILPIDTATVQTRAGLQGTFVLLALMALLGLSGLVLVIDRLKQSSKQAHERAEVIRRANDELEERVRQRTQELKRVAEAFQEQKDILEAVFNSMSEGAVVADQDGKFLIFNPAAQRIIGKGPVDAEPAAWPGIYGAFHADMKTPWQEDEFVLWKAVRGEATNQVETFFRNPQKPEGTFASITGRPLIDENGMVRGGILIIHDITEHKRAEVERESFIQELEAQNAELERFTYTVSHDLKSPLVTIKGFLGLLERDAARGDTDRMKRDIAQISDAADTMSRLLSELLELSRIGRTMNPAEEISLGELAQEAVRLVAGQIEARGVAVEIAPAMPVVYGDRVRLLEVYQNLIDNAVRFMGKQKQPRVEIGTRPNSEEIVCYVRDNGIGIAPQYREKVFGLFERLDQGVEGTGIGLALVKRIVEVHGGRVWVESEGQGRGSTFFFTLPWNGQETYDTAG